MYKRTYNSNYRYKLHKLSVGKCNLKLRLQQISKRNNSKIKNMPNYLSINNENRNSGKTNTLNYNNSVINNNKMVLKDHSKEGKNSRVVIPKNKMLSITSNSIINFNNFYTNENINNKTISSINNEMNTSINENINNSFVHVTLNSNNPYFSQNKINITEVREKSREKEKEKEKEKKDRKQHDNEINRKPISADIKYNIRVNKIISNNNNNKNIINHKISIKEKLNIIEENKNRVIKTNRRESSVRLRQDNSSFSKKSNLREKYNSNNTKKNNYSPLLESNKS